MSIDKFFDAYTAERGITRRAEVEPDHACQVFPDNDSEHAAQENLARVRSLVARQLG